jgi:hypothetical protein
MVSCLLLDICRYRFSFSACMPPPARAATCFRTTCLPIFENKNGLMRSFLFYGRRRRSPTALGRLSNGWLFGVFGGRKSQTSDLSNQETGGTIAKPKKEALRKNCAPNL